MAVDDEPLMLTALTNSLKKVFPAEEYEVVSFDEPTDAIAFLKDAAAPVVYAFLDIQLRGMLGIDLASEIKKKYPAVRIIFCTAYAGFALDAFDIYAVGYLLKPITEEKIRGALKQIDLMLPRQETSHLYVQTFGNFAVFHEGKLLPWKRQKAKELFAFLIDRRGAPVSNAEIAMVLWDDDTKVRNVQTVMSSLRQTLEEAGCGDVLVRTRNQTSVDTSQVQCDLYDYLAGDPQATGNYQGEYMSNYSWAEFTNGELYTHCLEEEEKETRQDR